MHEVKPLNERKIQQKYKIQTAKMRKSVMRRNTPQDVTERRKTNYGHFGPKTLRTLDTSALLWWVRTVRTDRHWCRSVLKTVRT